MDPITLIAVVGVLAAGFAYFRSSAAKVWRENADAYEARAKQLETQIEMYVSQVDKLEQRIHELEARPDWTEVVKLIGSSESHIIDAVKEMHQAHAGTFKCPMQPQ